MKFDDEKLIEALRSELGLAHPDSWVGAYGFGSQGNGRARAESERAAECQRRSGDAAGAESARSGDAARPPYATSAPATSSV